MAAKKVPEFKHRNEVQGWYRKRINPGTYKKRKCLRQEKKLFPYPGRKFSLSGTSPLYIKGNEEKFASVTERQSVASDQWSWVDGEHTKNSTSTAQVMRTNKIVKVLLILLINSLLDQSAEYFFGTLHVLPPHWHVNDVYENIK